MENSNPQTFADLVANFSHIRLATKEDNQAILDFYKNETMKTGEETISFDRGEDFFAFYELTTDKYWCFLFLNKDNSIGGIGSILRHHRQVNGQFIPVAYFCDLRISASSSRITKIQWRKFFDVIINNIQNLNQEEYCLASYTAILADNNDAVNSLTKSGRGITYRYLGQYQVNSYLNTGLLRSSEYETKEISKTNFLDFYHANTKDEDLAEMPEDIIENISLKSDLKTHIGVFNRSGELVAVAMPILKNKTRKLKVQNLNSSKKWAGRILKLFGRPTPSKDGKLSVLDISHFVLSHETRYETNQKAVTESIIQSIQTWIKSENLLAQTHIFNIVTPTIDINKNILNSGICFQTKGNLYEIHPETEQGLFPKESFRFEGAFL